MEWLADGWSWPWRMQSAATGFAATGDRRYGSPAFDHRDFIRGEAVELLGDGVEGGFSFGDGLVELGDFLVEGGDAGAEGGFGGGAEGEEVFDEAGGVEGFGDVEVAEGVAPLGGEEGGVGAVVEAEGFAVADVEGEFVVGVGDGESGAGLEQGVEGVELVLEGGGVLFLGPFGEFAGGKVGGGFGRFFPGWGGDVRPQPVGLGRGGRCLRRGAGWSWTEWQGAGDCVFGVKQSAIVAARKLTTYALQSNIAPPGFRYIIVGNRNFMKFLCASHMTGALLSGAISV